MFWRDGDEFGTALKLWFFKPTATALKIARAPHKPQLDRVLAARVSAQDSKAVNAELELESTDWKAGAVSNFTAWQRALVNAFSSLLTDATITPDCHREETSASWNGKTRYRAPSAPVKNVRDHPPLQSTVPSPQSTATKIFPPPTATDNKTDLLVKQLAPASARVQRALVRSAATLHKRPRESSARHSESVKLGESRRRQAPFFQSHVRGSSAVFVPGRLLFGCCRRIRRE